jgi:hypothetical protein
MTMKPDELIQYTLEEYKHCLIQEHTNKGDVAMMTKAGGKPRGQGKKPKSSVKCGNCGREGHTDKECWRSGGGAKGQGPKQKKKELTASANVVMKNTEEHFAFFCGSTYEDIAAALPGIPAVCCGAIVDSGAMSHFCADKSKLLNFQSIDKPVTAADGHSFRALGVGNITIELPNGQKRTTITLKDTLYTPDIPDICGPYH